jgi:hypothetical protein
MYDVTVRIPKAALRVVGLLALGSGLATFASTTACGPSFQAIYEGNVRFEHCYALEENPQKPMPDKADCWHDWSVHYTYGQTRDRIQYAIARYVALSQAPNSPTDEAMMMAAPGMTPRRSTISAPAVTNAFAPPPKVFGEPDASAPGEASVLSTAPGLEAGAPAPLPGPALPSSDCGDKCGSTFRTCNDECERTPSKGDGGAPKKASCRACEPTYKTCMRACFK